MLSLRDVIDFASMSEELAADLAENVNLPDLGAAVARHRKPVLSPVGPCAANDLVED
ncbi:MAG: hypothetical protein ABID63_07785 [Pseudomonadota bacterium]